MKKIRLFKKVILIGAVALAIGGRAWATEASGRPRADSCLSIAPVEQRASKDHPMGWWSGEQLNASSDPLRLARCEPRQCTGGCSGGALGESPDPQPQVR